MHDLAAQASASAAHDQADATGAGRVGLKGTDEGSMGPVGWPAGAPGLTAAGVLSVQRLAGNRAAAALVRGAQRHPARHPSRPPRPALQRASARVEHHGRTTSAERPRSAIPGTPTVQRDWLPDIDIPDLADILGQIPGYDMLTLVVGFDPATGRDVEATPSNLVRAVMGLVPGGRFVHDRLVELEVLQDVYELIDGQLAANDLTRARLERDVDQAWDEVDLTPRIGIVDEAIAVAERHLRALLGDVERFAGSLVDQILGIIKEAAVGQAEKLLAESESARKVWDLARAVLRYDPLRGEDVDATTEQVIEKFLLLIGKEAELEQMRAQGTLAATAEWLDTQLDQFRGIIGEFRSLIGAVLDALSFEQLPQLPQNLLDLAQRGLALVQRIADFAATVAAKVLQLIKDALLGLLAEHAHKIPGFHLLTVILGRNPITGEDVPRTAENLIRGFFTLIPGGQAQYDQLAETGVIPQAAARIEAAVTSLGISWEFIVGLFTELWQSFTVVDLTEPTAAFDRIVARFQEPIGRLVSFVSTVVQEVFTLVLQVMGFPSDLLNRIIANAMAAFDRIAQDPVAFFLNLLSALKMGLGRFFDNIVSHLADGLAAWLLRGLEGAGVRLPEEITLESVLDLVLQVLGITVENLWAKLAERIGPERVAQIRGAVDRLSGIWEFVKDVQERGIVAIWDYIAEKIGNLWDLLLQKAQDWIMTEIVEAVVTKLLSMLDPTGIMAVVNSFLAFFRAVQSAIEYLREILEIVDRYVATIAEIAAGTLEPAAAQMEGGLAAAIPVAIGFLANQVGLGNIAEKIREIIGSLRELVEGALDWLLDRAMEAGSAILGALGFGPQQEPAPATGAAAAPDAAAGATPFPHLVRTFSAAGKDHELFVAPNGHVMVASGTPKELGGEHQHDAVQQAQTVGEADEIPSIEEMNDRRVAFEQQLAQLRASEQQGLDPNDPRNRHVLESLETLTRVVRQVWSAIHYTGEYEPQTGERPGLGAVNPHSRNRGLQENAGKEPAEHLVSEHVVPRRWISNVFETVFDAQPISDSQYDRMYTVNIYTGAAADKTNRDGHGDNTVLRDLFTDMIRTGQDPSGFIVTRVDLTYQAVTADHRARNLPGQPKPDRAAIAQAAGEQLRQAVAFLRENSPAVGRLDQPRPEGLDEARRLSSKYGFTPQELAAIPGLIGSLTRWLNENEATADPSMRRQVRLYQEKLRAASARFRAEDDGTTATGYTDEYRARAVALFQEKLAAGATPNRAAVLTVAELPVSPTTGRTPVPSTVRNWAGS